MSGNFFEKLLREFGPPGTGALGDDTQLECSVPIRTIKSSDAKEVLAHLAQTEGRTGELAATLQGFISDPALNSPSGLNPFLEINPGAVSCGNWIVFARQYLALPKVMADIFLGERMSHALSYEIEKYSVLKEVRKFRDPLEVITHPGFQQKLPGYGVVTKGFFAEDIIPADTYIPDFDEFSPGSFELAEMQTSLLEGGYLAHSELAVAAEVKDVFGYWHGYVAEGQLHLPASAERILAFEIPDTTALPDGSVIVRRDGKTLDLLDPKSLSLVGSIQIPEREDLQFLPHEIPVQTYSSKGYTFLISDDQQPQTAQEVQQAFWLVKNIMTETGLAEHLKRISFAFLPLGNNGLAHGIHLPAMNAKPQSLDYPQIAINLSVTGSDPVRIAQEMCEAMGRIRHLQRLQDGNSDLKDQEASPLSLSIPLHVASAKRFAMEHLSGVEEGLRFYVRGLSRGFFSTDEVVQYCQQYAGIADAVTDETFCKNLTVESEYILQRIHGLAEILGLLVQSDFEEPLPEGTQKFSFRHKPDGIRVCTPSMDFRESEVTNHYERDAIQAQEGVAEHVKTKGSRALAVSAPTQASSLALIAEATAPASETLAARLIRERSRLLDYLEGQKQFEQERDAHESGHDSSEKTVAVELKKVILHLVNTEFRELAPEDLVVLDIDEDPSEQDSFDRGGYQVEYAFGDRDDYEKLHGEMGEGATQQGAVDISLQDAQLLLEHVLNQDKKSFTGAVVTLATDRGIAYTTQDAESLYYQFRSEHAELSFEQKVSRDKTVGGAESLADWVKVLTGASGDAAEQLAASIFADAKTAYLTDRQVALRAAKRLFFAMGSDPSIQENLAKRLIEQGFDGIEGPLDTGNILPSSVLKEVGHQMVHRGITRPVHYLSFFHARGENADDIASNMHAEEDSIRRLVYLEDLGAIVRLPSEVKDFTGGALLELCSDLRAEMLVYLGSETVRDLEEQDPAELQNILNQTFSLMGMRPVVYGIFTQIDTGLGWVTGRRNEREQAAESPALRAQKRLYEIHTELESMGINPDDIELHEARKALGGSPQNVLPALPEFPKGNDPLN